MSSKKPSIPSYSPSPQATQLENTLMPQVTGLANTSYSDYLNRFTMPVSPLQTTATNRLSSLMGAGYNPQDYQSFLNQISSPLSPLGTGALTKEADLLSSADYSGTDYSKIQKAYLDSIEAQYATSRADSEKSMKESLIANNLLGSGPGYDVMTKFAKDTSTGAGDIASSWAYQNIQNDMAQKQYEDALQRGDIMTAYNMALTQQQNQQNLQANATQLAEAEKSYYDALQRGDIQTAFNMSQLLGQNQVNAATMATNAQLQGLQPALSMYGQLSAEDLARYQAAMQAYNAQMQSSGSYAGLGSLLGLGTMLATGGTLGGSAIAGAAAGSLVGGGLGGMFKTYP